MMIPMITLMIQEAHIGLGIMGHEGTAAAQASDFAFTQFKFLRRALLVHGHWYYVRWGLGAHFSVSTIHTHIFPKGVVHRVENGWGLTKVAAVLLNGLLW